MSTLSRPLASAIAIAIVIVTAAPAPAVPRPGRTERISIGMDGQDTDDWSAGPVISADGRFVAFGSYASNLVPGDTNERFDAFVLDRATGQTERVSVAHDGSEGKGAAVNPSISGDGRYVAFHSGSPNLLPDDENLAVDVYVRDRVAGTLEVVSVASDGSPANGSSAESSISADGRYVAFESEATNLVPGDTNGEPDIFVYDRLMATTVRVSVASGGGEANDRSLDPVISGDGRHVAFRSGATNLVEGDTNGFWDVFVHDLDTIVTERVSVATDGAEATFSSDNPSISADGRHVAFDSRAENLVPADNDPLESLEGGLGSIDVFVRDRSTGRTERVSVTSAGEERHGGGGGMISPDGRFVVFSGDELADEDTNGQWDMWVRDRLLGTTERVSIARDGGQASRYQTDAAISSDGRYVAFVTRDETLVPGDANDENDVYLRDRGPAIGIGGLEAAVTGDTVSIQGWARYSGAAPLAATDPVDDGAPGADPLGAEIVEASLALRPEEGDLLATIRVTRIPGVRTFVGTIQDALLTGHPGFAGVPGIVYGVDLVVDGTPYQLRALRAAATTDPPEAPSFGLYRCEDGCTMIARLRGGFGTTGEEVQIALPLDAVGAAEGEQLSSLRAFTAPGESETPVAATMDEVALGSLSIPGAGVEVGIAPAGASEDDVSFVRTDSPDGRFWEVLEVRELPAGSYEVWARPCVGGDCRTGRLPIELP